MFIQILKGVIYYLLFIIGIGFLFAPKQSLRDLFKMNKMILEYFFENINQLKPKPELYILMRLVGFVILIYLLSFIPKIFDPYIPDKRQLTDLLVSEKIVGNDTEMTLSYTVKKSYDNQTETYSYERSSLTLNEKEVNDIMNLSDETRLGLFCYKKSLPQSPYQTDSYDHEPFEYFSINFNDNGEGDRQTAIFYSDEQAYFTNPENKGTWCKIKGDYSNLHLFLSDLRNKEIKDMEELHTQQVLTELNEANLESTLLRYPVAKETTSFTNYTNRNLTLTEKQANDLVELLDDSRFSLFEDEPLPKDPYYSNSYSYEVNEYFVVNLGNDSSLGKLVFYSEQKAYYIRFDHSHELKGDFSNLHELLINVRKSNEEKLKSNIE